MYRFRILKALGIDKILLTPLPSSILSSATTLHRFPHWLKSRHTGFHPLVWTSCRNPGSLCLLQLDKHCSGVQTTRTKGANCSKDVLLSRSCWHWWPASPQLPFQYSFLFPQSCYLTSACLCVASFHLTWCCDSWVGGKILLRTVM